MKSKTNKSRAFLFNVGLALSLGLMLFAFEWQSNELVSQVTWVMPEADLEEEIDIPITEHKEPPVPKKTPTITIIEDDSDEQDDDLEDVFDEVEEDEVVDDYVDNQLVDDGEEEEEEVSNEPFLIVENPAKYPDNFYKYMKKNIKYPRQAKRMGIEGKVFLSFVVNQDGSLTDIQVTRGIGGGCDEEAIRILENSPKWTPGKQRGVPVRQRVSFPVRFTLKSGR